MGEKSQALKFLFAIVIISQLNTFSSANSNETLNYNKSWIRIDASNNGQQLVSGETWRVSVEYYLDPSEHTGTTTLYLWAFGPWIETPDGKYATQRGHISYGNMSRQATLTSPGRGSIVFSFTVPDGLELVKRNNPLYVIAGFKNQNGTNWPWQIRTTTTFIDNSGYFDIDCDVPGNLFTYDEPVQVKIILKDIKQAGETRTLNYIVYDTTGDVAAQGQTEFTALQRGQEIYINPKIEKRGTFLIQVDIPGWETRSTTFARIPDLSSITLGRPTKFGMTMSAGIRGEEAWAIGERLGFSFCRCFAAWYNLQPEPDFYNLDGLEKQLEEARKYGIETWLCVTSPPPFAYNGKADQVSYKVFDCNLGMWGDFVSTVTTRLKGKLYGWEWLNELTPGGCSDPVGTYLQFCKTGTETAKAIDPEITTILAGGLFPRSFRNQVLASGIGNYIDALPVHYQNGYGVAEARQDLDLAGHANVQVWDDESAASVNAWAVPPLEELQNTHQCDWILKQWPDELASGCDKIIYFGGIGLSTGSFGYLLDDQSPRPVAATLAVLTSKLVNTKPLGTFLLGKGGLFHLFERNNKPILVASTYETQGENVFLNSGSENVRITDYQGNERIASSIEGKSEIQLNQLPFFIEDADLDTLKAYVVPEIRVSSVGSGTSSGVNSDRRIIPQINMLKGLTGTLFLKLRNLYDYYLTGSVIINLPEIPSVYKTMRFSLRPQEETVMEIPLDIPAATPEREYDVNVVVVFDLEKLPAIDKHAILNIASPDSLGNLMPNGDFESPPEEGREPDGWKSDIVNKRISSEGLGDGLGKYVVRFQNSDEWVYISRNLPLRGGQTYLYTAWVRNENMGSGSNMTQHFSDGTQTTLYDVQVISCGPNNPYWQLFTCRKQMPLNMESVSFTPVAKGPGFALWDNIRVTVYEGSDFAAEACKIHEPPEIDGILGDNEWIKKCPIPLIGRNQLSYKSDDYEWTPDNLSAVGYMMWDQENLYVALKVRDNVHYDAGSGSPVAEDYIEGDSIIVGIDPTNRGAAADARAFAYYISSASPGGGSGQYTLFIPENHSGAMQPGQLFKDSSIYNLVISDQAGVCVYEMCIPLSEIGISGQIGTKAGLSIQINDNDSGAKEAQINWGNGLYPTWSPENFGIVTFVE